MANPLLYDGTWAQQFKYESAEAFYQEVVAGNAGTTPTQTRDSNKAQGSTLKSELAQARQNITKALNEGSGQTGSGAAADQQVLARLKALETENNNLKKASQDLTALVKKLESRVVSLEKSGGGGAPASSAPKTETKPAAKDDDEDSDFDPFGDDSDSDDEETKRRLAEYAAKKGTKPVLIAKSSLLIDVKPWDDETDMAELERLVRTVTIDGLLWGASKLVPVGYGIKKLQINAVIEDEKVSTDALEEAITGFEDHVQSMDIAAFNKI